MSRSYHNPTTVPTPRSDGHSADARRAVPVANPATAGVLAGAVGLGTAELLAGNRWFRMHEDLGTGPGFYYLWDQEAAS